MGLYTEIALTNAEDIALAKRGFIKESEIRKQTLNVLVDTGAYMLAITEAIKQQLGLSKVDERKAELADGTVRTLEVVGPVKITFKNRISITTAMVLPSGEPLLGAIPMEDLDVIINPLTKEMIVNPENPDIPKMKLK